MDLPESLTERLPFLEPLEEDWLPISRVALVVAVAFYAAIMLEELRTGNGLLDVVFVPVHEGGHLLFRWFGEFVAVAGGTFLQLAAPFALAVYLRFSATPLPFPFACSFSSSNSFRSLSTWPTLAPSNFPC